MLKTIEDYSVFSIKPYTKNQGFQVYISILIFLMQYPADCAPDSGTVSRASPPSVPVPVPIGFGAPRGD